MFFLIVATIAGGVSLVLLTGEFYAVVQGKRFKVLARKRALEFENSEGAGTPIEMLKRSQWVPKKLLARLDAAMLKPKEEQGFLFLGLLGMILIIVLSICLRSLLLLPVASALLIIGGISWLRRREKDLERALHDQIPGALDSLAGAIGSGLSLVQAFESVARETKAPLREKLEILPAHVGAGMSLREALLALQQEFSKGELETLFIALDLHHRTGGNLKELLMRSARSERERNELCQQLTVKTAQASFSAKVVGILPLALLGGLTVFSSDYSKAFFTSTAGIIILVAALLMEALGYVLVRKAAQVDLS